MKVEYTLGESDALGCLAKSYLKAMDLDCPIGREDLKTIHIYICMVIHHFRNSTQVWHSGPQYFLLYTPVCKWMEHQSWIQ